MLVVGLTGGIGAGKSTVAEILARRGAAIIDVDAVGREILNAGGPACSPVAARFGPAVVAPDGGINRAELAAVVFRVPSALADLERISHPLINEELQRLLPVQVSPVVVLDMAVLVESRLGYRADGSRLYDVVLVVEAPWELRLARLIARGMSEDEAAARRVRQATDEERRRVADFVIANDGDRQQLEANVDEVWSQLIKRV